ncbi:ABC transporter substrate-binding protein [Planomonospora parontospora]|uniref:ABC transporter substrate-binding protein n=1 Tax=Planomonospora parontospora TaxID=58119 RepID=UPI001670E576|nr:ABC transporter substrate-binding protein [Planomonospora parontospora]GGL16325.1 ABC transporter substrate-binding protein [Planomonospora parontospora subsp. antibiotica]GII15379.1 ABC transporter substrate-binding protein [Planomonospora parontospora subsp. antibiotica]
MRNRMRIVVPLLAVGLAAACSSGGSTPAPQGSQAGSAPAAAPGGGGALPRNETLYTSGTQWGPPANFNPLREWDYATGTEGLVYESLFHFDGNAGKLVPWLAQSGTWVDDKTYELKLRQGVTWSDGKPFTAKDVVFTFELGKMETVPYHNIWEWLEKAEAVDDQTVKFTFSKANYQEWDFQMYSRAIVPQHVWEGRSEQEVLDGKNENPVGTGAYTYSRHDQDRVVWQRRDDWWGKTALNMEPKPKYIVDIVNSSNEVAMGLLLQKGMDLSNNFLPGAANLVKGNFGITTYYPEPPYMLSANTAFLVLNTKKKPMDDPAFRKALASSIDTKKIVEGVYGNLVKAASPTGLLPQWEQYIDQQVVADKGFSFDTAKAKKLLADAGYKDSDGDGFVENKDGSKIELDIIVPSGWTDWMESIRVIAASAKEAGINITPDFPDFNALVDKRGKGDFDLLINNERQLSNTPWTYYDYMFQLPVQKTQNTVNFGRYENKDIWKLVQELDQVKTDDAEGMKQVMSKIQAIHLDEMPIIPLWYNGLWSQVSNSSWTNWPSSVGDTPKTPPTMWRNWLELGGFETLTQIKPAS